MCVRERESSAPTLPSSRSRKRARERERERESVCERERERKRVSVRERELCPHFAFKPLTYTLNLQH